MENFPTNRHNQNTTGEDSIWDVYNNVADIKQEQDIRVLSSKLQNIQIYTAVFATVLIGILVESMKLLKEDPNDVTVAILLHISSQLRNATTPPYRRTEFEEPRLPSIAVIINGTLSASLFLGVLVFSHAFTAHSTINGYIAQSNIMDAKERSLIRHDLFLSIKGYRTPALYGVMYASFSLFLFSIALWVTSRNQQVGYMAFVALIAGVVYSDYKLRKGKGYSSSPLKKKKIAKQSRRQFLEWDISKWTTYNVELDEQSTSRLLLVLAHAIPFLSTKRPDEHWHTLINHILQSCLDKVTSQEPSQDDAETIQVLLMYALTPYFRTISRWTTRVNLSPWGEWAPLQRLVGPLSPLETPRDIQLGTLVSIIQARHHPDAEQGSLQLVDIFQRDPHAHELQGRWLRSFAIDSLSVYLWTRERSDGHKRISNLLAEVTSIPHGRLCSSIIDMISAPLALSALYSVAFGNHGVERTYWASEHPVRLPSKCTEEVQALHGAITSHIAALTIQESSLSAVKNYLQSLCRLLAYNPSPKQEHDGTTHLDVLLEKVPSNLVYSGSNTLDESFTALSSAIWLQRIELIPRIHEYLDVLLSCRRRFPSTTPVWRNWGDGLDSEVIYLPASLEVRSSLDSFSGDRRLVEVVQAFDKLLAEPCSASQHRVMVQLVVDDLCDLSTPEYYTSHRKAALRRIKDPALRLIGARAASITLPDAIPPRDDPLWSQGAWLDAVIYWGEQYKCIAPSMDEPLVLAALLQCNTVVHSAISSSSSKNQPLKDQVRHLLKVALDDEGDNETCLLLHKATHTASWFSEHLTEMNAVEKLLDMITSTTAAHKPLLPLLAILLPLISSSADLETIVTTSKQYLLEEDFSPSPIDVDWVARPFERMVHSPPPWLQLANAPEVAWWENMSKELRVVTSLLRADGNATAAKLRRFANPPRPAQELEGPDIPVVLQTDGRATRASTSVSGGLIQGLLHRAMAIVKTGEDERTAGEEGEEGEVSPEDTGVMDVRTEIYSCSATWDI